VAAAADTIRARVNEGWVGMERCRARMTKDASVRCTKAPRRCVLFTRVLVCVCVCVCAVCAGTRTMIAGLVAELRRPRLARGLLYTHSPSSASIPPTAQDDTTPISHPSRRKPPPSTRLPRTPTHLPRRRSGAAKPNALLAGAHPLAAACTAPHRPAATASSISGMPEAVATAT
jgi:hypothetical protein